MLHSAVYHDHFCHLIITGICMVYSDFVLCSPTMFSYFPPIPLGITAHTTTSTCSFCKHMNFFIFHSMFFFNSFIKNRLFSNTIYSDYSFCCLYCSNSSPTSLHSDTPPFSLSLEKNMLSRDNDKQHKKIKHNKLKQKWSQWSRQGTPTEGRESHRKGHESETHLFTLKSSLEY